MERELTKQGEQAQADLDRRRAEARGLGESGDEADEDEAYDDTSDEEEDAADEDAMQYVHMRLEGVLGISQCLVTDSGACVDVQPGLAAQVGLYYYGSRFFGFGLAASVAQWDDSDDLLQIRVLGIARATLPIDILELTAGAGLGFARLSSELSGIELFGVSVPLNARIGFFGWEGVLIGVDATINIDLYEGGTLLVSGQFGPFMEAIF